jgi:hypothetical protein
VPELRNVIGIAIQDHPTDTGGGGCARYVRQAGPYRLKDDGAGPLTASLNGREQLLTLRDGVATGVNERYVET